MTKRRENYLPENWEGDNIDTKSGEYRLPEDVMPRGEVKDPMKSAETAYSGSFDSYSVMSGGDLRVNAKDFVNMPAYAYLKDEDNTPLTLHMRGAEFIRSQNLINDKRLYQADNLRNIRNNVQQFKWFNRKVFDAQHGYYN